MAKPTAADLSTLSSELSSAESNNLKAQEAYQQAGRNATNALNRLNQAQKGLDAALVLLKKEAPRDSDWARENIEKERRRIA